MALFLLCLKLRELLLSHVPHRLPQSAEGFFISSLRPLSSGRLTHIKVEGLPCTCPSQTAAADMYVWVCDFSFTLGQRNVGLHPLDYIWIWMIYEGWNPRAVEGSKTHHWDIPRRTDWQVTVYLCRLKASVNEVVSVRGSQKASTSVCFSNQIPEIAQELIFEIRKEWLLFLYNPTGKVWATNIRFISAALILSSIFGHSLHRKYSLLYIPHMFFFFFVRNGARLVCL